MHNNMIINMSGHLGKGMGMDMNIEHLIRNDKVCTTVETTHHTNRAFQVLFLFHGIHANWERLGNLSAICALLSFFKKRCGIELDSRYSGSSHIRPDTSSYIWMIVEKARDQRLNEYVPNREGTDVLDAIKKGDRLIRGSTLESFNQKIMLKAARYRDPTSTVAPVEGIDEDIDEIPPMDINLDSDVE